MKGLDCLIGQPETNNLERALDEEARHRRLYWRSRRGMLELELKLVPFMREHFHELDEDEQAAYEAMLAEEDWQIFDWLQGREVPDDPTLKVVVGKIAASAGSL